MALFDWGEEYSVGVNRLDEQHRKLVEMVNDLDSSIRKGGDQVQLRETLLKLLDYTAYHFATEEKLLTQHGYPEIIKHKEEHDTLSWRVLDLRSRYEAGEGILPSEVLDFLTGWLKNHILNSDKRYGAFLKSKGLK